MNTYNTTHYFSGINFYFCIEIMACFVLLHASYYGMFAIMLGGFHIMIYGCHVILYGCHIIRGTQWKYRNAIWNVACIMMQFWPEYRSI